MQSLLVFVTLFLVLISVPMGIAQPQGLAIFSQAQDNQPDTQPSLQLIFRNIGLGTVTDPLFNTLRRRWDSIRSNPFIQALLVQQSPASASSTTGNNMRYARSINHRTRRNYHV